MMPSAAELTRIRADMQNAALPDTCIIYSLSQVSDGEGGYTDTWSAAGTVDCRLDLVNSRIGIIGEEWVRIASLKPYSLWVISVPYGTALTSANRVGVGSDTFNVVEVDAGRSWGANVRATLEKV